MLNEKEQIVKSIDELFEKARVKGHVGLYPSVKTFDVPARPGQDAYSMTRVNWVTLQKIIDDNLEIDEDKMEDMDLKVDDPSSPDRYHRHRLVYQGKQIPHKVNKKHSGDIANHSHKEEIAGYTEAYDKYKQREGKKASATDPTRLHVHEGIKGEHLVNQVHPLENEKANAAHRDEIVEHSKHSHGGIVPWMDRLKIYTPITHAAGLGLPLRPDDDVVNNYIKEGYDPIYMFDFYPYTMVYSKAFGLKKFDKTKEAVGYIKNWFELSEERKRIRKSIINVLFKSSDITPKENTFVLSKYQSGEYEVVLAGKNGAYEVSINGSNVLSTEEFQEAIAKFYSEISKIMKNKTSNKDMALELFGEKVIENNRNILPMIAKLGDDSTAKWLINFDSTLIEPFFKDNGSLGLFEKYEPISNFFAINPVQEEQGQGESENATKPRRDAISIDDYKKDPKIETNLIEETGTPYISPAGISKEDVGILAMPEDNLPPRETIFPQKVEEDYSMKIKASEQKPILEKDFMKELNDTISVIKTIGKTLKSSEINSNAVKIKRNIDKVVNKAVKLNPEGWIGSLNEHPEGIEKIGHSSSPIIGKAGFSMDAPKERIGEKINPIEGDKIENQFDLENIKNKLGFSWDEVDVNQFKIGMKEELEHADVTGGDPIKTAKIVLAHLKEDRNYYTKLMKVGLISKIKSITNEPVNRVN